MCFKHHKLSKLVREYLVSFHWWRSRKEWIAADNFESTSLELDSVGTQDTTIHQLPSLYLRANVHLDQQTFIAVVFNKDAGQHSDVIDWRADMGNTKTIQYEILIHTGLWLARWPTSLLVSWHALVLCDKSRSEFHGDPQVQAKKWVQDELQVRFSNQGALTRQNRKQNWP